MAITPMWVDDEQRVLLYHYTKPGVSDWQEYRDAVDVGMAMVQAVSHGVVLVFDPYDIPMPQGNPLPHLRYAINSRSDNVLGVVAIISNHFAVTITGWLQKLGVYTEMSLVGSQADADKEIETFLGQVKAMHH